MKLRYYFVIRYTNIVYSFRIKQSTLQILLLIAYCTILSIHMKKLILIEYANNTLSKLRNLEAWRHYAGGDQHPHIVFRANFSKPATC